MIDPVLHYATPDASQSTTEELRKRAEAAFLKKSAVDPTLLEPLAPEEMRRMIHEFHVHQIELEMQNEELRSVHAEMEATRARYFNLYDLAPVGYLSLSGQGVILEANIAASTLLGVSRSKLVKQPITQFILPEDQDIFHMQRKRLLENGMPEVSEFRMLGRDRKPFWARLDTSTVRLAADVAEFRVVLTDITERKQAEEALRANELFQKDILNSLPAHMAVLDETGKIVAVNEPWLEFARENGNPSLKNVGVGAHYLSACVSACREEDLYATAATVGLHSVLSGKEKRFSMEYPCDGPDHPCWYVMDVHRPTGRVKGAIVAHTDITERVQSRQLLNWEKSALEVIVSAATLPEVLDGLMLSLEKQLSRALCSILLLDEDGIHLRHGGAPSLPDAYNHAIAGLVIGPAVGSCGTAAHEKRQVIVADIASDPLWADFRDLAAAYDLRACWSTPIIGSKGGVLGTFAIYYHELRTPLPFEMELIERAVHITLLAIERKQAEQVIHQLNTGLEQRVAERTAALTASNKELEAFSYSVSHDLRAPLRAVDGFSRILLEDHANKLDEDGQRALGLILSETQRMGRLIDDLLAFSRLGRQSIEPTPVDMHALAQSVFDESAAREPERNLRLNLHPLPPACGSEALIRQAWVNLVSNSFKFTSQREIGEIEIGVRGSENGMAIYFIKDNGAGFDMRHASKLFGVFQRLHTQQEFPGTGVGLAFVQRIVSRHGGRIWAEGEVEQGSTFYFTLPNQNP